MRLFLTLTAAIASTCLVLWMASGYESLLRSYDVYARTCVRPLHAFRRSDQSYGGSACADGNRYGLAGRPGHYGRGPDGGPNKLSCNSDSVVRQLPPPGSGTDPSEMPATAILHECLMLGTDASEAPFPVSSGKMG